MLYNAYGPRRWYWGAVIASRKAAIVFVTSIFDDPTQEVHWLIWFLGTSIILNSFLQPYIGAVGVSDADALDLQQFDSLSLYILLTTAWSGVYFDINASCQGENKFACTLMLVMIVGLNGVFFLYCIWQFRSKARPAKNFFAKVQCCGKKVCCCKADGTVQKIRQKNRKKSVYNNPLSFRRSFVSKKEQPNPLLSEEGRARVKAHFDMMQAKREMEGRSRMRIRSRADRLQRIRRISAVQDARKAEEAGKVVRRQQARSKSEQSRRLKSVYHRQTAKRGMGLEMTPISFPKEKKVASPRNKDMWVKAWDSESGTEYFYHLDTHETVWSLDEVEGMVEVVENPLRK